MVQNLRLRAEAWLVQRVCQQREHLPQNRDVVHLVEADLGFRALKTC